MYANLLKNDKELIFKAEDIKDNMYIRYGIYGIGKLLIKEDNIFMVINKQLVPLYTYKNIQSLLNNNEIKISIYLEDLIEDFDYINGEEVLGYRMSGNIEDRGPNKPNIKTFTCSSYEPDEFPPRHVTIYGGNIHSVLTSERFNEMEFKVKGDEEND